METTLVIRSEPKIRSLLVIVCLFITAWRLIMDRAFHELPHQMMTAATLAVGGGMAFVCAYLFNREKGVEYEFEKTKLLLKKNFKTYLELEYANIQTVKWARHGITLVCVGEYPPVKVTLYLANKTQLLYYFWKRTEPRLAADAGESMDRVFERQRGLPVK